MCIRDRYGSVRLIVPTIPSSTLLCSAVETTATTSICLGATQRPRRLPQKNCVRCRLLQLQANRAWWGGVLYGAIPQPSQSNSGWHVCKNRHRKPHLDSQQPEKIEKWELCTPERRCEEIWRSVVGTGKDGSVAVKFHWGTPLYLSLIHISIILWIRL